MSKRFVGIGLAALLTAAGLSFTPGSPFAAAAPTTRPARLVKPWSELKDLSEEQITKIKAFHEEALAEEKKIKAKEEGDCMGVLTDAQKKELETIMADDKKATAERRARAATEPSDKPTK